MMRPPIFSALLLIIASSASALPLTTTTQTNVLQNIDLNLTVYQQNSTNVTGTKVTDKVSSYNTKDLIEALSAVTGVDFGNGAKLVRSTIYANVTNVIGQSIYTTIFSTNITLAPAFGTTNGILIVGGNNFYGLFGGAPVITISGSEISSAATSMSSALVEAADNTSESVTINTNAGFLTTITPLVNSFGLVTNANIVEQQETTPAPTEVVFTNISTTVGILYSRANAFFSVSNYLTFSTNSTEIVSETGSGLAGSNALSASNLSSQTAYSLQGLNINYYVSNGSTNLNLGLTGFVKQTLKVDRIGGRVSVDLFGAGAAWTAIGAGFAGGAFTTNSTNAIAIPGGYLTNAYPVVVEGAVNMSFLKNLAQ